jgi:hypothetical protein
VPSVADVEKLETALDIDEVGQLVRAAVGGVHPSQPPMLSSVTRRAWAVNVPVVFVADDAVTWRDWASPAQ